MRSLKIAVITGGHPFDVQPFHRLVRTMPGVDAFIQHTDEFASEPQEVRDSYDALLFYSMVQQSISDDVAWYAGKPKTTYERLGQTRQGVVLLHHALMSYQDWPLWDELTGMKSRYMTSFHQNEQVQVEVADPHHPIVRGIESWNMLDETYIMKTAVMPDNVPGNQILLRTNNASSIPILGWTRMFGQARVFCFASGHGQDTYANASFQRVLANGVRWVAEG